MTLRRVDSIWISDTDEEDCQTCGLRYFVECDLCKQLTCAWCGEDGKNERVCWIVCLPCRKKSAEIVHGPQEAGKKDARQL